MFGNVSCHAQSHCEDEICAEAYFSCHCSLINLMFVTISVNRHDIAISIKCHVEHVVKAGQKLGRTV